MLPTIAVESVDMLATVVATAVPVLLVAYIAMRVADPVQVSGDDQYDVVIPASRARLFSRWVKEGMNAWTGTTLVRADSTTAPGDPKTPHVLLRISPDYALGGDLGFILRSPICFGLALIPFVFDATHAWSRLLLGIAVVFLMLNVNALVMYYAAVGALRYNESHGLSERMAAARSRAHKSRRERVLDRDYSWQALFFSSLIGLLSIVIGVFVAFFLTFSTVG